MGGGGQDLKSPRGIPHKKRNVGVNWRGETKVQGKWAKRPKRILEKKLSKSHGENSLLQGYFVDVNQGKE